MHVCVLQICNTVCMFPCLLQCCDTYWVESFNHMLLSYIMNHVHFGTKTFEMKMNLAVLNWVSRKDCVHKLHVLCSCCVSIGVHAFRGIARWGSHCLETPVLR